MSASSTESEARAAIDRVVTAELGREITPAVDALVAALLTRHGGRIAAILFYGSCLRMGDCRGRLDLYVIVDRYRDFYEDWRLAAANTLLPPNVFCIMAESAHGPVSAKVSVISYRQFARAMRRNSIQTSFWARFCQPASLVYARDRHIMACIRKSIVEAVITAAFWAARLNPAATSPQPFWADLFRLTYGAELRAERTDHANAIYEANTDRYYALTQPALVAAGIPVSAIDRQRARRAWQLRRTIGRALSVIRLIKAVFTFEGGIDYVCWKIERHSGVIPTITAWQRRHPILAGPAVAWRLYRRGAFR